MSDAAAERSAAASNLQKVQRQIDKLVEALMNGTPPSAVNAKLIDLEARKAELEARVAALQAEPERPRLHPGLANTYRARMAELRAEVEGPGGVARRETLRAMIKHVAVSADRIELVGELSTLLLAAGLPEGALRAVARLPLTATAKAANGAGVLGSCADGDACSAKWDAGTGFEPVTFRL